MLLIVQLKSEYRSAFAFAFSLSRSFYNRYTGFLTGQSRDLLCFAQCTIRVNLLASVFLRVSVRRSRNLGNLTGVCALASVGSL